MHKNHLAVAFKMDIFETECPTCCWAEMWSPKTKEDVATITLSFTMPMITKATADKRLRVVAMMRFKANAFKAFRKITGPMRLAFCFFSHPSKTHQILLMEEIPNNHQPQVVQNFFHQQYDGLIWLIPSEWGTLLSPVPEWILIMYSFISSVPTKGQWLITRKVFISESECLVWVLMTWGDSNCLHPICCHVFIIVHFLWCLTGRSLFTLWASFVGSIKTGDSRLTAKPCHADKPITFPMFFDPLQQQNQPHFSSHHHQGALKANQISQIPTESYADQQWQ